MNQPLVTIRCTVFNHEPYLRQCLDGFVMQKTNFKFEVWVHDDASTDGSPAIIKEYAEKYPDIIKPYFEKENQYSNHYDSFQEITYSPQFLLGKYIAMCEGDDYWIDPLKLQKQVDYLEEHPDCTMCCNRTKLYSEKKHTYIGENYCYNHDSIVKVKDVIYRSGLFISTCSIIYRKEIRNNYPDYCRKCAVGDYPLQIMAAMKGRIYYFNDAMSVYRIDNPNSWMKKQKWHSVENSNLKRINSMIRMFNGFADDFPQYNKFFKNKIANYLMSQSPEGLYNNGKDLNIYINYYKDYFNNFPFLWKLLKWLRFCNIPGLRGYYSLYTKPIYNRYKEKKIFYNY